MYGMQQVVWLRCGSHRTQRLGTPFCRVPREDWCSHEHMNRLSRRFLAPIPLVRLLADHGTLSHSTCSFVVLGPSASCKSGRSCSCMSQRHNKFNFHSWNIRIYMQERNPSFSHATLLPNIRAPLSLWQSADEYVSYLAPHRNLPSGCPTMTDD